MGQNLITNLKQYKNHFFKIEIEKWPSFLVTSDPKNYCNWNSHRIKELNQSLMVCLAYVGLRTVGTTCETRVETYYWQKYHCHSIGMKHNFETAD